MKTVYCCPRCKSREGFAEHNIVHADFPFAKFTIPEDGDSGGYAEPDSYGPAKVCWESAEMVVDDPMRYKCTSCGHVFYEPLLQEIE